MPVPRLTLAASFVLALALAACSSSTSPSPGAGGAEDGGGSGSGSGGTSSGGASSGGASSGASGSGDSGASPSDAGATIPKNGAKLVLDVPSSFAGTTRELDVVVTPTLPIAGPPAGILYQAKNPVLKAGQPLTVEGDATGVSGSYYVVVVLYMQGGGTFSPTPGVDYVARSKAASSFAGAPIDLGTMNLALASADGGP